MQAKQQKKKSKVWATQQQRGPLQAKCRPGLVGLPYVAAVIVAVALVVQGVARQFLNALKGNAVEVLQESGDLK